MSKTMTSDLYLRRRIEQKEMKSHFGFSKKREKKIATLLSH